ncbi:hypothetical protein MM236_02155 [Belliella sp. DSM 107340]|uniref:Uncharacterized protein n=1 Tax=Belliella calami TaxID=2923436 RepID=A0ABS9UJG5_9BACT|nr:hypothetical protein [Belliella calami]MCH7396767.1 hypothetical protein [Belliella calami]
MKNIKNTISRMFVIVMFFLMSSCEDLFPRISIGTINDSNHDIQYFTTIYKPEGLIYPDTILPLRLSPPFSVSKSKSSSYLDFNMTGRDLFSGIPSDTLSVFIFHPDTLALYDWGTIRSDYKILVRYDLSYQDLERLDWKVYYPPNDQIDGIKMFPSE